jgi:hypothetical protein
VSLSKESRQEQRESDFGEKLETMDEQQRSDLFSPHYENGLNSSRGYAQKDVDRSVQKKQELEAEAGKIEQAYEKMTKGSEAEVKEARETLASAQNDYTTQYRKYSDLRRGATDAHKPESEKLNKAQDILSGSLAEESKWKNPTYKHSKDKRYQLGQDEKKTWNAQLGKWRQDLQSGGDEFKIRDEMDEALKKNFRHEGGEDYRKTRAELHNFATGARGFHDRKEALSYESQILGHRKSRVDHAQGALDRKTANLENLKKRGETRVSEAEKKAEQFPELSLQKALQSRMDYKLDSYELSPELRSSDAIGYGRAEVTSQDYRDGTLRLGFEDGRKTQATSDSGGLFVRTETADASQVRETQFARDEAGKLVPYSHQNSKFDESGDMIGLERRIGQKDGPRTELSYRKDDEGERRSTKLVGTDGSQRETYARHYNDGREYTSSSVTDPSGKETRSSSTHFDKPQDAGDINVDGLSLWMSEQPQHLADRIGDDGKVRSGFRIDSAGGKHTHTQIKEYTSADGQRKLTSHQSKGQRNRWEYEASLTENGNQYHDKQTFFQGTKDTVVESTTVSKYGTTTQESEGIMWETAGAAKENGTEAPGYTRSITDSEADVKRQTLEKDLKEMNPELLKNPEVKKFLDMAGDKLSISDSEGMMLYGDSEDNRKKAEVLADRSFGKDGESSMESKTKELKNLGFRLEGQQQMTATTASGATLTLKRSYGGEWELGQALGDNGQPLSGSEGKGPTVHGSALMAQVKNKLTAPGKMQQLGKVVHARRAGLSKAELTNSLNQVDSSRLSRTANKLGLATSVIETLNAFDALSQGDYRGAAKAGAQAGFEAGQFANGLGHNGAFTKNILGRGLGTLGAGFDLWSAGENFAQGDYTRGALHTVSGAGTIAGVWAGSSWAGPVGWGAAAVASITLLGMDYHDGNKIAPLAVGF